MKNKKLFLLISFTLVYLSFCYSQVDLNSGLIHHYDFNNVSTPLIGNTSFSSNSSFNFTEDSFGNLNSALQFNGTTEYIELENSEIINFSNDFSISLWIKIAPVQETTTSAANGILSKWILDNGHHEEKGYPFTLRTINQTGGADYGKISFAIYDGNISGCKNGVKLQTDATFNDNNYHMITFGREDGMLKLYVDCNLEKEMEDFTTCSTSNQAKLILGARNETFVVNRPNNFTGAIDELRIYDRFLNEDEINALCDISLLSNLKNIDSQNFVCEEIKVYPNPFILKTNLDISEDYHFQLIDIMGNQLYLGSKNNFDFSVLSAGIYFIKFPDCSRIKKIIKLK